MYFQSGCPDIRSVLSVAGKMFLKRIKTYKKVTFQLCIVKTRHIAGPRVLNMVFLDWHSFTMFPTKGERDMLFLVRIPLASVCHFLVCTISRELVRGLGGRGHLFSLFVFRSVVEWAKQQ